MALRMLKRRCVIYLFIVSLATFLIFSYFTSSSTKLMEELRLQRQKKEIAEGFSIKKLSQELRAAVPVSNVKEMSINSNRQNKSKISKSIEEIKKSIKSHSKLDDDKAGYGKNELHPQLINYDVHVFYYPWYKNPLVDGGYSHWNHELIPHWSDKTAASQRKRHHTPPGDIGANFYPELGPYSSKDPAVVNAHMSMIRESGVGVVVVSWYPPHHEASREVPVDNLMPLMLDAAHNHSLKIAFHVEPYKDRSGASLKEVMSYMVKTYGSHPGFYRTEFKGRQLPVVYLYDSYQIDASEWAQALKPEGSHSIRGTEADAVVLGLLVERQHFGHLLASGFDGFYTYFASNGFSYGSSWRNWPFIAKEAVKKNLLFVPSIGPGYIDTRVRVWNGKNTKPRLGGKYYRASFDSAMQVKPKLLSITSFNEWHEGTQIEPAIPWSHEGYKYEDYMPESPKFYMDMTKQFVLEHHRNMTAHGHDDAL